MAGEAKLEDKCRDYASSLGTVNYRFKFLGVRGGKDAIFFPGKGSIYFVEFKNPNGKGVVHPLQSMIHTKLRNMGIRIYVVSDLKRFKDIAHEELRNAGQ